MGPDSPGRCEGEPPMTAFQTDDGNVRVYWHPG